MACYASLRIVSPVCLFPEGGEIGVVPSGPVRSGPDM